MSDKLDNLKAEERKLKNILESSAGDSKKQYAQEELEKVQKQIKRLTKAESE